MNEPRTQRRRTRLPLFLVLASALTHVARAGVRTVGPTPSEFQTLASAVTAAQEGDIVIVASGTYAGFTIDGKSLSILADAGADVRVSSLVRVKNLASSQCVVLSGLVISGSSTSALTVLDVQGAVRVQDSTLRVAPDLSYSAVHGAVLTNVASAAFEGVVFQGGLPSQSTALAGDGLRASDAHVSLAGCRLRGGTGAPGMFGFQAAGTSGGAGLTFLSGELFASDTIFEGGPGGHGGVQSSGAPGCAGQVPLAGGAGGTGLVVGSGALARLRASTMTGAAGGLGGTTTCGAHGSDGAAGPSSSGAITFVPGAARTLHASDVTREGQNALFHFDGVPGDRVFLFLASAPPSAWQSSSLGVVLIHNPFQRRVFLGTLSPGGTLDAVLPVPELGAGVSGALRHAQAWSVDAAGTGHLGAAVVLALIDRSF